MPDSRRAISASAKYGLSGSTITITSLGKPGGIVLTPVIETIRKFYRAGMAKREIARRHSTVSR